MFSELLGNHMNSTELTSCYTECRTYCASQCVYVCYKENPMMNVKVENLLEISAEVNVEIG